MAKILFVDDRMNEIIRQWQLSGCEKSHQLLPLEPFDSIKRTLKMTKSFDPDIIVIGFGLGKPEITGANVIQTLRNQGYTGYIIGNSGDPGLFTKTRTKIDGYANRNPNDLKQAIEKIKERRSKNGS